MIRKLIAALCIFQISWANPKELLVRNNRRIDYKKATLEEQDAKAFLQKVSWYFPNNCVSTEEEESSIQDKRKGRRVILLGEVGYFRPSRNRFRTIYGSSLINYRLSLQLQLCGQLYALLDTNFLHKNGKSIGLQDATKVFLVPIDIGMKYYIPIAKWVSFYVKAAGEITATFIENDTPFVEDIAQSSGGAVTGVGLFSSFMEDSSFCIDLFADYSFVKLHTFGTATSNEGRCELGGLILGGGIGYKF